jgi:hypothetical protein
LDPNGPWFPQISLWNVRGFRMEQFGTCSNG